VGGARGEGELERFMTWAGVWGRGKGVLR